jgi:hypothetical protein
MRRPTARLFVVVIVVCGNLAACNRNPTRPGEAPLAAGRWAGDGACLSVAGSGCDLVVGCGRGEFAQPILRADGTFEVDGTYRIEIGPISIEPAPAAHFSGVVTRSGLTLKVVPSGSLPPAAYLMRQTTAGTCPILCL